MSMPFLFNRKRKKVLAEKQREAVIVHKENIKSIVQSRESATELKKVLEQNNIIIQIAGAVGHAR